MKVMLDTNMCIFIIKQKPLKVLKQFDAYNVGDIGISSITLAELQFGVAKSLYPQKNQLALDKFVLPLEIAGFDEKAAISYGIIRRLLKELGKPIGVMDMLIGAHAYSLGVTLATNNIRAFKRIKGLKVVDWSA